MSKQDELPALYFYIGKRLIQMREQKGVNQTELADKAGIGRTTVVNIENGHQRITIEVLYKIAYVLDCEPGDLLPHVSRRILQTKQEAFMEFLNQVVEVPDAAA